MAYPEDFHSIPVVFLIYQTTKTAQHSPFSLSWLPLMKMLLTLIGAVALALAVGCSGCWQTRRCLFVWSLANIAWLPMSAIGMGIPCLNCMPSVRIITCHIMVSLDMDEVDAQDCDIPRAEALLYEYNATTRGNSACLLFYRLSTTTTATTTTTYTITRDIIKSRVMALAIAMAVMGGSSVMAKNQLRPPQLR